MVWKGVLVLGVCGFAALAEAQVRAGGQFQVNTYTPGNQVVPAVALADDGSFLVAWHRSGSGNVTARRFDGRGVAQGAEFVVGASGEYVAFNNASVAHARGRFVVTWTGQDGSYGGIFGRRYDRAGLPLGAPFQANSYSTLTQMSSSVAAAADGSFVVTWGDTGFPNGNVRGAFAQRYDSHGAAQGANFQVDNIGNEPVIAMAARGDFVVAWGDFGGVFARRFGASGAPLGPAFLVSAATAMNAQQPNIAADPEGNFVVAWYQSATTFPDFDVHARRYGADGTPRGADFRVNLYTPIGQVRPSVSVDPVGNFVLAWSSNGQDQSGWGVFGRRFRADGTPRGGEFLVPTITTGTQAEPVVASDRNGNFVVVWEGATDGAGYGIFGQRFGGLQASALVVDASGNGVLEAGESVVVSPSWRNVNGAAQTIAGAGLSFSGPGLPGNPTYTLADAAAAYGTVPDGTTASCATAGDCYAVQVSVPGARPAFHWDARLHEEITPEGFGQVQDWRLHVGGSFADVPSTHPYYRFVETLLHTGVAAGCAAQAYCPEAATARQAMAVFVLAAKEGPSYAPPACTVPVFADVPASSPFCRWIEELVRRNVVAGCGGSNFCPDQPVSRGEMSVFALRTLDPVLDPPACDPPNIFADVPETSPFCPWIEELARRGVTSGCGGQNYCPTQAVTRGEMAVFITVTFGLALYGP